MRGWQLEPSICIEHVQIETSVAKLGGDVLSTVESQPVHFLAAPVKFAESPEDGHAADKETPPGLGFKQDRPIFSNGIRPARHLSWFGDVEDENASGLQSVVNAPEQAPQSAPSVSPVERVVQTFADGCHSIARWQVRHEQ